MRRRLTSHPLTQPDRTTPQTALRTIIQITLTEGHLRAQKAVERERVVAYWTVGDHLVRFLDANPVDYGSQVLKQLSTDLGLRSRLLFEIVKFSRAIPKVPSNALLSWSHYRTVLAMPDIGAKNRLLAEAEKMRWTVAELTKVVAAGEQGAREQGGKVKTRGLTPLVAKRGEPHLYKLIEKPHIGLVLDQGFRTYTIPPRSLPADA